MARPRSDHVRALKAKLIARLGDGFHRPGDRFFSNRAVAARYGVSYQTAHRVIEELEREGRVERRAASGTYVAGARARLCGVELWFHPRARRPESYGARLLGLLRGALRKAGISHRVRWAAGGGAPARDRYPVLWETPALVERLAAARRYALLLNDRPAPGIGASVIDAVATDDFSAGVCAAQVLAGHRRGGARWIVVAGPAGDRRSRERVAGFLSRQRGSRVIVAGGWFVEHGARVAARVMAARPAGVFCVNDRLAEALLAHCARRGIAPPPVVGHDNAPVAETLNLTTIETAWDDMVGAALAAIRARLAGSADPARLTILAQRPVRRLSA